MKRLKVFFIAIVLTFFLGGCSFSSNSSNDSTSSTSNTEEKAYELSGNLVAETDYSELKNIFDTNGIVIFYNENGQVDKVLLDQLKSLASEYKVKVYCVNIADFSSNSSDANIKYIYGKLSSIVTNYDENGSLMTPDFYEIEDGKIVTRLFGVDIDCTNPTSDNLSKLKEEYRSAFAKISGIK